MKKIVYIPFGDNQRQAVLDSINKEIEIRRGSSEDAPQIAGKAIEQFVCYVANLSEEKNIWTMEHSALPVVMNFQTPADCEELQKMFFVKDVEWSISLDKNAMSYKDFISAVYGDMALAAKTAAFYAAESY